MQTNPWIARSQRFYRWLLRLYPQAYRETYEAEMLRMFTNQCLDAYKQSGKTGILSLWTRTLLDLGITVLHEHFIDPRARLGLLEADSNAPLPWKGVFLILIPGLLFFISQIAQLTSTLDWFFLAYYRAAYYLIVPVLLVWLITRRFPVWGLIPFGLLYATLSDYSQRLQLSNLPILRNWDLADSQNGLGNFLLMVDGKYLLLALVCVLGFGGLLWYNKQHQRISPAAWRWLGLYIFLVLFQIVAQAHQLVTWQFVNWSNAFESIDVKYSLIDLTVWYLYHSLSFLLLIFIGLFFARKYGGFSFLLLLGYLLRTILFGRYGEWSIELPFFLIGSVILIYRFVLALVAPVWLTRAASLSKRQRAAAVPVAIAISSHILLNILAYLAMIYQTGYPISLLEIALMTCNQFITAAGLGLAVALYLPKEQEIFSPSVLAAPAN